MNKDFDCIKMKEEIQAKIYAETKDMTFPELDAYFNKSIEKDTFWRKLSNSDNAYKNRLMQI